jgi:hypothetical protein
MILAFCCCFFNGSSGDVPKLLKAMEKVGVISHFDESDLSNSDKIKEYMDAINKKINDTKTTISSKNFTVGENALSIEQFFASFNGENNNNIAPYPSSALFEQNIVVTLHDGTSFSDCVETAIRHIVTMMCEYDPEKDEIKAPNNFNNKAKEFFAKYNKKSSTNGRVQSVHNDWANLCRDVTGAKFGKDGSLLSDWRNILDVIKYLR